MKANVKEQQEVGIRRAAVALVAIAAVATGTVLASPPSPIVVGSPAELPARQTGDAMLLRETIDGRMMPPIEQNQGPRLITFDVADPLHIKGEGSVHLDASGPFDFVAPMGNQAELVRFRQGQEDAVLDLPRVGAPKLRAAQGLTLSFPMPDAVTVTHPTMDASPALDLGAIDPVLTYELNRMFDVRQVRAQMTRTDTGTTFMLRERLICD